MSKLYLECYSGISGDMTVGALLDLGADRKVLEDVLSSVPADGFEIRISTVQKSGVNACDFDVILEQDNHDHDMEYLFGTEDHEHGHDHDHHHDHEHDHDHDHEHEHEHDHEHEHEHEHDHCACGGHDHEMHDHAHEDHEHGHEHHHHHLHEHRSLSDVRKIVDATKMSDRARELTMKIFGIVAQAEAEVHGKTIEEVHFHEVGALDSIVDIISIAVCFDDLAAKENITDVIVPVLYDGQGTIRCQHGIIPVPVPATTSIVRTHGIALHIVPDRGEFVTPTGAAAVAALRTSDTLPEQFTVRRTGMGAGKRAYSRAGVMRAMLID